MWQWSGTLISRGWGWKEGEGEIGPEVPLIEGKWETGCNQCYPLALHTHLYTHKLQLNDGYWISNEISPSWPTAWCRSIPCDYGLQSLDANIRWSEKMWGWRLRLQNESQTNLIWIHSLMLFLLCCAVSKHSDDQFNKPDPFIEFRSWHFYLEKLHVRQIRW